MDSLEHVYHQPDDDCIKSCARALSSYKPSDKTGPIADALWELCGKRWIRVVKEWYFCDKYGIWKKLNGGQEGCWKLVSMLRQPEVQAKLIKYSLGFVIDVEAAIGVQPPQPVGNGVPVVAENDDATSELEKACIL